MYGRLSALPDQAQPLQRGEMLAAFSVGTEIIQLRQLYKRFDLDSSLDAALEPLAQGQSITAVERLASLDQVLAARPERRDAGTGSERVVEPGEARGRYRALALRQGLERTVEGGIQI